MLGVLQTVAVRSKNIWVYRLLIRYNRNMRAKGAQRAATYNYGNTLDTLVPFTALHWTVLGHNYLGA